MVPVIELFRAAKSIRDLANLIDGGNISSSLGDVEMAAARTAFDAVSRTVDKRAQVWTCIGHLSSAQHAFEHFIRNRPPGNVTITRSSRESDANVKRRFILVLKAVCYKYLDESVLCHEALNLAQKEVTSDLNIAEGILGFGYILAGAASGVLFAELFFNGARGVGQASKEYGIDETTFDSLASLLKS